MGTTCCTCDGEKEFEVKGEQRGRMIDMSSNVLSGKNK